MARRKKQKLDGHYRAANLVSVWLGTFPSEAVYERYFKEDWENRGPDDFPVCLFWNDLGIRWFDHDFQEGGFGGRVVPVAELLDQGWSYLESFREPLLEACRAKGVESANAVMFLYDCDYPQEAGYSSPHMRFIGVFTYNRAGT